MCTLTLAAIAFARWSRFAHTVCAKSLKNEIARTHEKRNKKKLVFIIGVTPRIAFNDICRWCCRRMNEWIVCVYVQLKSSRGCAERSKCDFYSALIFIAGIELCGAIITICAHLKRIYMLMICNLKYLRSRRKKNTPPIALLFLGNKQCCFLRHIAGVNDTVFRVDCTLQCTLLHFWGAASRNLRPSDGEIICAATTKNGYVIFLMKNFFLFYLSNGKRMCPCIEIGWDTPRFATDQN